MKTHINNPLQHSENLISIKAGAQTQCIMDTTCFMIFDIPKIQNGIKPILFLFVVLLVIGLCVYKDYGISWDEPIQRKYGLDTYNYLTKKDPALLKNKEKYYGPAFELFLISIEKACGLKDSRDIYFIRHLFTFYTFSIGVVFFYFLCKKLFDSQQLGLLASSLLVISPRIFSHAFYNSKDIPLMVFFILSAYTATIFIETPNTKTAIFHALTSAITIDIRILGVLIPVLTITTFLLHKKSLKFLGIYLVIAAFLTTAFWPILWNNPIKNFSGAIKQMSKYPQSTSTLTLGKNLKSTDLPWYYIPVWISATTPIIYLFGFLIGTFFALINPKKVLAKPTLLIFGWVFCPLIAVIVLKSTLYNGWRQMFFIYPGILLILIYGLTQLKKLPRFLLHTLLIFNMVLTAMTMIKMHPYQNVYFNKLTNRKEFEQDYWGLAYRKGLEYILKNDQRESIKVHVENFPGIANHMILPKEGRQRLIVKEKTETPDYLVTNKTAYSLPLVFSVKMFENRLLDVYTTASPKANTTE